MSTGPESVVVKKLGQAKLITCILAKGKGQELQKVLIDEKHLHAANVHHARGIGRSAPLSSRGIGEQLEKDVLDIAVDASIADELFEFIYYRMDVDSVGGAMLYMTPLMASSDFSISEDINTHS